MKRNRLAEDRLRGIVAGAVRNVLREHRELNRNELIEKYYTVFEKAYNMVREAHQFLNNSLNVYDLEDNRLQDKQGTAFFGIAHAFDELDKAENALHSVYYGMKEYLEGYSKEEEPESWYERFERGDFDEY